jgi:hypothetical protein
MVQLPETIDRGVDSACGSNCHYLCLLLCAVARVCSGFVMIGQASLVGIAVRSFSKLPREGWSASNA